MAIPFLPLSKKSFGILPIPELAVEFRPAIVCALTSPHPGKVVERATTTKEFFFSHVGLFDLLIVRALNHGSLVALVIFAVAELKGTSWRCDHRFISRIA